MRRRSKLRAIGGALAFCSSGSLYAAEHMIASTSDLANLTLADLLAIEVTSVSRSPEKTWTAAAAVHVITQDDIRRSGQRVDATTDWSLQAYYDHTERDEPTFSEIRDTIDIDVQRRTRITPRQELTCEFRGDNEENVEIRRAVLLYARLAF
ncbi:MAG: hypothetical protein ACREUX_10500 [Burkholderiales bacterium]